MVETVGNEVDILRFAFLIGWVVSVVIVFFHASHNDQNVLGWTLVAMIPGLGFIAYFMFYYIHGIGSMSRRTKRRVERQWEFELTDKGKPRDPNEPEEGPDYPGKSKKIITESPFSKEADE